VAHRILGHESAESAVGSGTATVDYGNGRVLVLNFEPFSATLLNNNSAPVVVVNGQNLFHFEYHRSRKGEVALAAAAASNEDTHMGKKVVGYWEDGATAHVAVWCFRHAALSRSTPN